MDMISFTLALRMTSLATSMVAQVARVLAGSVVLGLRVLAVAL